MSDIITQYLQTIDYVAVLNSALNEIFRRRSEINLETTYNFERSLRRYMRAVESFCVILLPSLRDDEAGELIKKARNNGVNWKTVELLDKAVEKLLRRLDQRKILIKAKFLEVGRSDLSFDEEDLLSS